ncbi:hypothetical protein [Fusobacterium mortiferum]|uniref:Replication initiation protein n=1 Tax=Fusobacterium mortiferum TaxID=850 RepID=A0ABS2G3X7_FUSMR|nr:hypothetical protein [Fusobacterium mortiferum]MBM6876141.1 hypothetical protein [Fusobacterium mortiferum]
MEINFGKYRPIVLKTEVNKLEKILYHRYFLTKIEFDKILIEIPKKDIDIEKMKSFLYNLDYLEKDDEISTWIYKIKVKSSSRKVDGLEYCFYNIFLKYYGNENMENIYNAITNLGKNTFKYMNIPKNNFTISFQKLFHQGKNVSFINFLYEELRKRAYSERFDFFEEYFINYNSDLGKDLLNRFIGDTLKKENKIDNKLKNNLEIFKNILEK